MGRREEREGKEGGRVEGRTEERGGGEGRRRVERGGGGGRGEGGRKERRGAESRILDQLALCHTTHSAGVQY